MDKSYEAIKKQGNNYKGKMNNTFFEIREVVYIKHYSKPNKKGWKLCSIKDKIGKSIYLCKYKIKYSF